MSEHKLSDFAEQIIQYQKKHDLTDNEMAFSSHVSVERIHDIKSNEVEPNADEIQRLKEFMGGN
ncbi:hypothetical protein BSQ39_00745 [Loigolactobacillus backii]|uniref:HTH cro/C1-type domain-containing protein n=1 Tax=Loigolactobacillus backii TaxID=375175 RepID=A0A192H050_9LACO|nr:MULTISPECIES: LBP_cg2779 family protein [Loigolactobacillus]ANK60772.1 hypothetical protein AYR52_11230 [Loigolactobacillus backii]ANK61658.1 hypothetical protein AYR53_02095 [Loigolactobacillus backii]ANK65726.1 hypothetical protein AYR54_11025 [Loigolactobacillus backii]ANK68202.1 hypothetical protein AYR55_11175 [Loigolactobacillus backii]ANK69143.1 hypothetical protein AYR56_02615 [Loigolactobacillus backii]